MLYTVENVCIKKDNLVKLFTESYIHEGMF